MLLRAGNVIDSVGRGPGRAARRPLQPRLHARPPAHLQARRRAARLVDARARGCGSSSPTWALLVEVLQRRALRALARRRAGQAHRQGAHRARRCPTACATSPTRARRCPARRSCRVYPACNTNASAAQVTLGTSVGWADIYPPTYPEQWIDVTGLRGCFAYVHIADPENGVYESNEDNNEAQVIVRLPFRARRRRARAAAGATAGKFTTRASTRASLSPSGRSARCAPAGARSRSRAAASSRPRRSRSSRRCRRCRRSVVAVEQRGVDAAGVAGPALRRLTREGEQGVSSPSSSA